MALEAVVFDVGNVLIEWRPERLYEKLIVDPAARERFLSEVCPPAWNAEFDRGLSMPEGVEAHAQKHPAEAELIRAWWSRWPEMAGPAIEGSVALLRALKASGTPVYGLTNFAAETWEIATRAYPALTEFDAVVVSAEVGVIKPDPVIYEILERRTGRAPEALFFTDDSAPNVAAARARGWTAHHFRGAGGLRQALIEAGVLRPHQAPRLDP